MPNINVPVGIVSFFRGLGKQPLLDAGNMSNPPGDAGIQAGNYQFIQPEMIDRSNATNIPDVPLGYRNWGQFPLNVGDESGTFGGGVYSGKETSPVNEAMLFYDPATGLYYDIGNGFGE